VREFGRKAELPQSLSEADPGEIRDFVELLINQNKVVATHYQHVDGTSFAAPIVSSIVAQMMEANPKLTPGAVKDILISTADRIADAPAIRQGYGVVNARRAVARAKTEQHSLKTVGCGPPRIANSRLVFTFHDDHAASVSLFGDFNGWGTASIPLSRNGDALWQAEIAAPSPGRYQYKFLVNDERWVEDPSNGMQAPDNHGALNSVLVIE